MAAPPVYAFLHGGGLAPDSVAQPEPDVCVVPRDPHAYRDAHPSRAALVVEIAKTSYRTDRDYKFSLYARAGIADCWLVDVIDEAVEVHRDPRPPAVVRPLVAPEAGIRVADLLP